MSTTSTSLAIQLTSISHSIQFNNFNSHPIPIAHSIIILSHLLLISSPHLSPSIPFHDNNKNNYNCLLTKLGVIVCMEKLLRSFPANIIFCSYLASHGDIESIRNRFHHWLAIYVVHYCKYYTDIAFPVFHVIYRGSSLFPHPFGSYCFNATYCTIAASTVLSLTASPRAIRRRLRPYHRPSYVLSIIYNVHLTNDD